MAKSEKRKKWTEEKKEHARVTRARTIQERSAASPKQSSNKNISSESTKSSSKSLQPSPATTPVKDKNSKPSSATPLKKPKQADSDAQASANNDVTAPPPAKKTKYQYVDAVEKLENSTSIHVPKKLVLFVGNLPDDITKEKIMEHFKRTGGVKSVKIAKYKGTETCKGFAYVEFNSTISHRLGVRLHNTTMAGRKIIVEFAGDGKMTEKKLSEKLQPKEETDLKMPFDT